MNKLIINQDVLLRTSVTIFKTINKRRLKCKSFLKINYKGDKKIRKVKNTVNKYMADLQSDRLMTCQSERKSVVSRRASVCI
jgi:hypothetical protein